jgi:hypothetical protein
MLFMIFVNSGGVRRVMMKPRSKSFVSSSPLNALAQCVLVLGLFLFRQRWKSSLPRRC